MIRCANQIGSANYSLYGQESNGSTWALAKMNVFLNEKDNARIEWGDTLRNPKLIEKDQLMKFDVVVANRLRVPGLRAGLTNRAYGI